MKLEKEEVILLINLLEEYKRVAILTDADVSRLEDKLKTYLSILTA